MKKPWDYRPRNKVPLKRIGNCGSSMPLVMARAPEAEVLNEPHVALMVAFSVPVLPSGIVTNWNPILFQADCIAIMFME